MKPPQEYRLFDTSLTREAEERGYLTVKGINDEYSLIELAKSLGSPKAGADRGLIKELRVTNRAVAPPHTLSAAFGTASFPLHTDTAFWPVPARFLVMRAIGDMRRQTRVCSFFELFELTGARLKAAAQRAVWTLKTSTGPVYCAMAFRTIEQYHGFRYDRQCMTPANPAAREIDENIRSGMFDGAARQISWSVGTALVISNWQALHGRGPKPKQEAERILQRIYVE